MSYEDILSVSGVSKIYQIYDKPSDRLMQVIVNASRRILGLPPKNFHREFQALENVNLVVAKGTALGILGANGSGKSTLLQIIAGTMQPTTGSVEKFGRVAALLELGAGFNPDFTGRENITLNAMILGIKPNEIWTKIDKIIEYSGIEHAIDEPVRAYSSGMYARLAFAIAINIEPDLLIIDEALAVGDAGFQMKCLLSMRDYKAAGGSIIFVSHDTTSLLSLCDKAMVLDHGNVVSDGSEPLVCVKLYEKLTRKASTATNEDMNSKRNELEIVQSQSYLEELEGMEETRFGPADAYITEVHFLDGEKNEVMDFSPDKPATIRLLIYSKRNLDSVVCGVTLRNIKGIDVWGDNTDLAGVRVSLKKGMNFIDFHFTVRLLPGKYYLYCGIANVEGARKELDQRWPVRKFVVHAARTGLGVVSAPAMIEFGELQDVHLSKVNKDELSSG